MRQTSFAQELVRAMPKGFTMPDELIEAMDWLEKQGYRGAWENSSLSEFQSAYLALFPARSWGLGKAKTFGRFEYYGRFDYGNWG